MAWRRIAAGMAVAGLAAPAPAAHAHEVPARTDAECTPRPASESCYLRITSSSPLAYSVASAPAHGAASFDGAQLTYTPAAGFAGKDSLTYVATDGRGLTSAPATVSIDVEPQLITITDPAPAHTRRLLKLGRVRQTAPRRLAVRRPATGRRVVLRATVRDGGGEGASARRVVANGNGSRR